MITKPQLQRLIVMRLNFMHITEEREMPTEIACLLVDKDEPERPVTSMIVRQPQNVLEWLLPPERFCFGGNGKTWEEARLELIDGIWNRLHGKPVTTKRMCICQHCGRAFIPLLRRVTRFCSPDCRNANWHMRFSAKRREKTNATDRQLGSIK
jgi:hypothetical protein